jgi:hypothetical protein
MRRGRCDIDEILAYIQQRSPRGAHSVSLAIEYTIHMCALNGKDRRAKHVSAPAR